MMKQVDITLHEPSMHAFPLTERLKASIIEMKEVNSVQAERLLKLEVNNLL